MSTFKGFSDKETFTQIPDSFFQQILNQSDDPSEIKVTLYVLWRIAHMESRSKPLTMNEIMADKDFTVGISIKELDAGLKKSVERGSLLRVEKEGEVFFFLNSPRSRAVAERLKKGDWDAAARQVSHPPRQRPNIFRLYETSIGPLTPMLADALKDADKIYSEEQIVYAFAEAVRREKRSWKYVEAILRNRKEELDGKEQDRRDPEKDRRKYIEGEYSDFIEH
ncbi:DnaD domain-containing protein [Chloroflexota bacterium]